MAHQSEPMDVDCIDSDFDNKENTFHHNVPCTEKGYEELDVSELNMKLRYSMTPVSSPMSKSYTAGPDNQGDHLNSHNNNLTRSLNSTISKNDTLIKSLKCLPLQSLGTESFVDGNSNTSILRQQGSDGANIMVTISGANDVDENLSLPSSSSSTLHTPEATTPTKEIKEEGSPIMRGLKSVLNMFRSSTSPVPPVEEDNTVKQEVLSAENTLISEKLLPNAVASTPIAVHKTKDGNTSKRCSPYKDSIIFNEDLEKELNWKEEKVVPSPEKMIISKLLLQNSKSPVGIKPGCIITNTSSIENNFHSVVEYMDTSNNTPFVQDRTVTDCATNNYDASATVESDCEFVDCETTFSKSESYVLDIKGIQEKMSTKLNLDETKQVFDTTKNADYVDCNSTFSKNESYVLDIKEIHEKISAKINQDQTKHTSYTTEENIPTVNKTIDVNVTSMSFADLDLKLDTTVPTNYSDYSQATADILSALEKLEGGKVDGVKQTNTNQNTTEQRVVTGQEYTALEPLTNNVILDKNNLEQSNETTESQNTQLNIIENVCDEFNTTLTEKQSMEDLQSNKLEIMNVCENELSSIQHTDFPVQSENKVSEFLEVNLVQADTSNDGYKAGNSFHVHNAIKTLNTFITPKCILLESKNIADRDIIPTECIEICSTSSNHIPETQLNSMPDVIKSDADNSLKVVGAEFNDAVSSEILTATVSNVNQKMSEIPPADSPLPENGIIEPLPNKLDELQNVSIILTTDNQIINNPSEVADNFDEKSVTPEVLIKSGETMPACTSETIITLPELKAIATGHVVDNSLLKNKTKNDFTCNTQEAQFPECQIPENIETVSFDVKSLKTLSENQIKSSGIILKEPNNLSPKNKCDLSANENIKNSSENSHEHRIDNNSLSQLVPSNGDTAFCQDNTTTNVNHITNEFSNSTENIVVLEKLTHNQNSEIEQMNITLNERLNLTHELPDLVNQTIVLSEDKMLNQVTYNVQDPEGLASNPTSSTNNDNSITSNILDTSKCTSDFIVKNTLVDKVSINESLTKTSKEVATNLPINDNKKSTREIENASAEFKIISSILSDDQPPKFFTNTPDSEPMEIEETAVDEEIIVSLNNSPYVSLMTDFKSVSERNEDDNIKKLDENEEQENTVSSRKIEEPRKNVNPELDVSSKGQQLEKTEELESNKLKSKTNDDLRINEQEITEDVFEKIKNPLLESNIASSPPITSKGYNFNFDEIDDPFATKTKIRLSPPLDSPRKLIESEKDNNKRIQVLNKTIMNRPKSQTPERKKPITHKKCSTSFDTKNSSKIVMNKTDETVIIDLDKQNTNETTEYNQVLEIATNEVIGTIDKVQEENINEIEDKKGLNKKNDQGDIKIENTLDCPLQASDECMLLIGSGDATLNHVKTTSSSEQSTYYSADASSTESVHSKNVFNLPEIDDVNFNPFAIKSKKFQSPTPDIEIENPFATRSKICQSPPPVKDIPFAQISKIISSPEVSIFNHSTDINHTMILNNCDLAQLHQDNEGEDKMNTEPMEKDMSNNITDIPTSNATDNQNLTTQEVNTEDEDTIEGPFLDADDDLEKMTDFAGDNDNMMMFNELQEAAQVDDDNLDGELFIDAEAFEFLLNQNKSNVVTNSGKESLFLKFDPLFAKRISSDGVLASLNKGQKRQSTPTKPTRPSLRNEASPIARNSTTPLKPSCPPSISKEMSPLAGPSTLNITYEGENNISQESNEDANITVAKPMMVVTPALNPAVTPRNKSITPARSNRRSNTFTSPAIAFIDRLLSLSANNSAVVHDSTIMSTQSTGEQTEADLALTQLRELLAEKEISVYNLRSESKELKDRLSTMESQIKTLEMVGEERLKKINELSEQLTKKTKLNKDMACVMEECERTIASLIADSEQIKKQNGEEKVRLIRERDEQTAHLTSMEVSFSDLHSKYEKSKQVILTCKANEEAYKKKVQEFEEQVTKMLSNYEMLKQHATAKLNHANQELEKINRAHQAEVVKLNAMIKRNQLLATSLQETLAQKTKANDELTAICDELINKVGSNK